MKSNEIDIHKELKKYFLNYPTQKEQKKYNCEKQKCMGLLLLLLFASLLVLFLMVPSIGGTLGGMALCLLVDVHLVEGPALLLVVHRLEVDLGLLLNIEVVIALLILRPS